MAARFNYLVQTGELPSLDFSFVQEDDLFWMCSTVWDSVKFTARDTRKKDAKAALIRELCNFYDTREDGQYPSPELRPRHTDPGMAVHILVDADSMGTTLQNLAPYNHYEWLFVEGFANPATNITCETWAVHVSKVILPDAADHYLTWRASQIVSSLGTGEAAFFVVVSRDAALQTTVELIKQTGHQAEFRTSPFQNIEQVLDMVPETNKVFMYERCPFILGVTSSNDEFNPSFGSD